MATVFANTKKWFKGLGKTAQKAVLLALTLSVVATIALAAWSQTRESSGAGMVLGTIVLEEELVCGGAVPMDIREDFDVCTALLTNNYDLPVTITDISMVSDRADIFIWPYTNLQPLPGPIAPGADFLVSMQWRAEAGAPEGPVNFVMSVTAAGE